MGFLQFSQLTSTTWTSQPISPGEVHQFGAPVASPDGNFYVRRNDSHLIQFYWNPAGAGGWEVYDVTELAGGQRTITNNPAVAPGSVYARADDGHLLQFYWNPAGAGGWEVYDVTELAGGQRTITNGPAVAAGSVYARGDDGHLLQFYWNPAGAGAWKTRSMGYALVEGNPAATADHVFARTQEGHLVHLGWDAPHSVWATTDVTEAAEKQSNVPRLRLNIFTDPAIQGFGKTARAIAGGVQWQDPPPPPPKVAVPSVIGSSAASASDVISKAGLHAKISNLSGEKDLDKVVVTAQDPMAGFQVDQGSEVEVIVDLPSQQQLKGPSRVSVLNASSRAVDLEIYMWDYTVGQWSDVLVAPYGGPAKEVVLPDGHTVTLTAVDATASGCTTGSPDEFECVYGYIGTSVVGDSRGPTVPWQIV